MAGPLEGSSAQAQPILRGSARLRDLESTEPALRDQAPSRRYGEGTMSNPNVAIIVLTWNVCEETLRCLRSLTEVEYAPQSVIAVDNGSTDGTCLAVPSRHPEVTLIRNQTNLGFAAGMNAGMRHAIGRAHCSLTAGRDMTTRAELEAATPWVDPRFLFVHLGYNLRPMDVHDRSRKFDCPAGSP